MEIIVINITIGYTALHSIIYCSPLVTYCCEETYIRTCPEDKQNYYKKPHIFEILVTYKYLHKLLGLVTPLRPKLNTNYRLLSSRVKTTKHRNDDVITFMKRGMERHHYSISTESCSWQNVNINKAFSILHELLARIRDNGMSHLISTRWLFEVIGFRTVEYVTNILLFD